MTSLPVRLLSRWSSVYACQWYTSHRVAASGAPSTFAGIARRVVSQIDGRSSLADRALVIESTAPLRFWILRASWYKAGCAPCRALRRQRDNDGHAKQCDMRKLSRLQVSSSSTQHSFSMFCCFLLIRNDLVIRTVLRVVGCLAVAKSWKGKI